MGMNHFCSEQGLISLRRVSPFWRKASNSLPHYLRYIPWNKKYIKKFILKKPGRLDTFSSIHQTQLDTK